LFHLLWLGPIPPHDKPYKITGFIEADGHFYCGFDLNVDGLATKVKCYMAISQKQLYKANSDKLKDNSNFNFMESIQEFLGIKTVNKIKRIKDNYVEEAYDSFTN